MTNSEWPLLLNEAKNHANFGRDKLFVEACHNLTRKNPKNTSALIGAAKLLLNYGFLTDAKNTLLQANIISPNNCNVLMSLANCELQLGNLHQYHKISEKLITEFPNNLRVLQQYLFFAEYLETVDPAMQLKLAKKWAEIAIHNAGGYKTRPTIKRKPAGVLNIGYVSADFCQHSVGLLLREVVAHHNKEQFRVFSYSNSSIYDWVSQSIANKSTFIDVSELTDANLAKRIESDQIDILIDLSGHTGGSRLSAFAYRPAPIMISMIGYYATTGLEYLDAFLLDSWHTSSNTASQFIENIRLLPHCRWCFYPAFPAPLINPKPFDKNGYITFGSFNNTLKYNSQVFDAWANVLRSVHRSRLVLKWRTFNDVNFCNFIKSEFSARSIDPTRIELRGPSFHIKMLEEYNDIDIALDPFPFSGGITSCEALYMGVPVITVPAENVASRQTYAFLEAINHQELVAKSVQDIASIAIYLEKNPSVIDGYRENLRFQMIQSPLMDIQKFTLSLEQLLISMVKF